MSTGAIFDVIVDIRTTSPTYGQWIGVELSAENGKQLLVPKGFLHGYVTRTPHTQVSYKCSAHYAPECDGVIHFADAGLDIDWGLPINNAIVSDKDRNAPGFSDFKSPFTGKDQAK